MSRHATYPQAGYSVKVNGFCPVWSRVAHAGVGRLRLVGEHWLCDDCRQDYIDDAQLRRTDENENNNSNKGSA